MCDENSSCNTIPFLVRHVPVIPQPRRARPTRVQPTRRQPCAQDERDPPTQRLLDIHVVQNKNCVSRRQPREHEQIFNFLFPPSRFERIDGAHHRRSRRRVPPQGSPRRQRRCGAHSGPAGGRRGPPPRDPWPPASRRQRQSGCKTTSLPRRRPRSEAMSPRRRQQRGRNGSPHHGPPGAPPKPDLRSAWFGRVGLIFGPQTTLGKKKKKKIERKEEGSEAANCDDKEPGTTNQQYTQAGVVDKDINGQRH